MTDRVFNTIVLFEKIEKNKVKNLLGCSYDIVPLDEKHKLKAYMQKSTSDGYRIDYQYPELKDFGRVKQVPYTGLGTFCREV